MEIRYILLEDLSIPSGLRDDEAGTVKLNKIITAVKKVYPFTNVDPERSRLMSVPIWTMKLLHQSHKLVDVFKIINHFNSNIEYSTGVSKRDHEEPDDRTLILQKVPNILFQDISIKRLEPITIHKLKKSWISSETIILKKILYVPFHGETTVLHDTKLSKNMSIYQFKQLMMS